MARPTNGTKWLDSVSITKREWPYNLATIEPMHVSVAEAKNRLPELIRAFESGESVIITWHGKPVAQLAQPPKERRVQFDGMRDQIQLLPGWDDPVDLDRFLKGDL